MDGVLDLGKAGVDLPKGVFPINIDMVVFERQQNIPLKANAKCYGFRAHPGFFLIKGALVDEIKRQIAQDCFVNLLKPPTETNFNKSHGLQMRDLWDAYSRGYCLDTEKMNESDVSPRITQWSSSGSGKKASYFLEKLRWASVGPIYDWTTRKYLNNQPFIELPEYMTMLATHIVDALGSHIVLEREIYSPRAALINYYKDGDMLCGHQDDAERDLTKPLISISLGCPGIFLMGGLTRNESPTALLLEDGDVAVLSGAARKSFHGLPRIFPKVKQFKTVAEAMNGTENIEMDKASNISEMEQYLDSCRVNVSIRDVR